MLKEAEFDQYVTNLRENQKAKTKTLWRSFGFRSKDVFLVFLEFFWSFFGGPELFSFNRKGFLRNLEKTKKPKNQNFLEKFWFQVKRCFFLVFLEFFLFFWFRFLKTQKTLGFFFGFLKEVFVEERQKTKKTQGFFVFLVRCLEYMYEQAMKKPKKP